MQAVVIQTFGAPSVLTIEQRSTPEPKSGEVLVAVKAAAINPSDVKNVAGAMHGTTLPRIPGRDFAGTVVAGHDAFKNQDVFGTGGDIGFTRDGSHAELILLPIKAICPKPPSMSMEAAGIAGVTFVTAWSALVTAASISATDTGLIIGAAGGVGSAAVQIATARGARVIGVVRSDADVESLRQMGVTEAINSRSSDIVKVVRSITNDHGADVVFDTSGRMFAESVEASAINGRIPIITSPPDGNASFNLRSVYRKEIRVLGVDTRRLDAVACAKLLQQMIPFFDSGQFKVEPGRSFPLASAVEAYETAAKGNGRVLLKP